MLRKDNIADRFSDIYKWNLWSSMESTSGDGSEVLSTKLLREWMICNLPKLKVQKLVDASCGDFNWMKHVINKLQLNYIGLDIVKTVIDKNNNSYANPSTCFKVSDICNDQIPSCDLILVRDCLFHLSFDDIDKFLINIRETNYKYLLTTTHLVESGFQNKDIITGDFRIINLFNYPFNFKNSSVSSRVLDCAINSKVKKEMILLEKKNVPTCLSMAQTGTNRAY